jgi:hypothetical protein
LKKAPRIARSLTGGRGLLFLALVPQQLGSPPILFGFSFGFSKEEARRIVANVANCQAFFKMLSLRPQSREEFRHANDDENRFGGLLNWCSRG